MKTLIVPILALMWLCSLTGCIFNQPIFTEGFSKFDSTLGGVWTAGGDAGDPRKVELAICAPIDDDRALVHYPANSKDALYYEARPLQVRDRQLLHLRVVATYEHGLPKPEDEIYTLLWVEREGDRLRVRALNGGNDVKERGVAGIRKFLAEPESDWRVVFGDAMTFRKLKDE